MTWVLEESIGIRYDAILYDARPLVVLGMVYDHRS